MIYLIRIWLRATAMAKGNRVGEGRLRWATALVKAMGDRVGKGRLRWATALVKAMGDREGRPYSSFTTAFFFCLYALRKLNSKAFLEYPAALIPEIFSS
jgi:hypothetical protein